MTFIYKELHAFTDGPLLHAFMTLNISFTPFRDMLLKSDKRTTLPEMYLPWYISTESYWMFFYIHYATFLIYQIKILMTVR